MNSRVRRKAKTVAEKSKKVDPPKSKIKLYSAEEIAKRLGTAKK